MLVHVAGWFVDARLAADILPLLGCAMVPGCYCCWSVGKRWEYSWQSERFIPRTQYRSAYNFALSILLAGVALLAVWVLLLTMNAVDYTNFSFLRISGAAVAVTVCGIVFGSLLDYTALRKTRLL